MSIVPSVMADECPLCHRRDRLHVKKKLLRMQVRIECECGVSGQWVDRKYFIQDWNAALDGWSKFQKERQHD